MLTCFLIVFLDFLPVLEHYDIVCAKTVKEDKHVKQQKSIVEFTKIKKNVVPQFCLILRLTSQKLSILIMTVTVM